METRTVFAAATLLTLGAAYLTGCQHIDFSGPPPTQTAHPTPVERTTPPTPEGPQVQQIEASYTTHIRQKVQALSALTQQFVTQSGTNKDKDRYITAHTLYLQLQPTAKRFEPSRFAIVNLDRLLNERASDFQLIDSTDRRQWMGWHQIEKDIWTANQAHWSAHTANLVEQTQLFSQLVNAPEFSITVTQICQDVNALLEQAAVREATGAEEQFSHTDLDDLDATISQAQVAYDTLRPLIRDHSFVLELDARFAATQRLLAQHRSGSGFLPYTALSDSARRDLVQQVSALRHSASRLADTLVVLPDSPATSNTSPATPATEESPQSPEGGKQ